MLTLFLFSCGLEVDISGLEFSFLGILASECVELKVESVAVLLRETDFIASEFALLKDWIRWFRIM